MATELSFNPKEVNLTLYRNDTNTFSVAIKDATGVAVSLTGATALLQVRDAKENGALLATLTTTVDTVNKVVIVTIPPSAFTSWKWDSGFYDLQVTFSGGTVTSIIAGTVKIVQDISR